MIKSILTAIAPYADRRVVLVLFMGFASGLPLSLVFGTMNLWLGSLHISKTEIGYFASVGTPYTLKFLWAGLFDQVSLPGLGRLLGPRRSWAIALQILLMTAIILMGRVDPIADLEGFAIMAIIVAALSASQDIVIDAIRIEILKSSQQAIGVSVTQTGYRLGLIASGAGALVIAQHWGWQAAYLVMGLLMTVGIVTVLSSPEPIAQGQAQPGFADAFYDFMQKDRWVTILCMVLLYKLGESVAGRFAGNFYQDIGFTNIDIAGASKVFGVIATLAGVWLGSILADRYGLLRALLWCGALQMVSNLAYLLLAATGPVHASLYLSIFIENIAGGMASAALVGYMSSLCTKGYTATQYALLSAIVTIPQYLVAPIAGRIIDLMGWTWFFIITVPLALPSLYLVWHLKKDPRTVTPVP